MAPKASSQSQAAPVTLAATAPPAHKPVESKEPHFAKPTKTKSKAKAPLRQSQSFSEKPGSLQIASQIRRVHGVTAASFPNYIEQNLKELGRRLPGQAEPTLRGALTVSGGDVDSAVVSLTTSTRAIATSDGPRKIKSHLEDDSITTPEPNDASTPRITKPNEKSTTGVTAVLKTRIQQLNQEFVPAKTAEIQDATSGTASDVDEFFDIPEDPYPTAQPNRSVENKAVARAQPATKAVKPKPSIMDVKKRKSAPAILGMTSQAPLRGKRSQRAAAAKASQVMHEVVEDDYEDNKELDQIDRVVVKSSKQRRSQNASRGIESMHTATQKKNESEATLNKKSQSNKRQKDFLPCDAQVEDIRTDSDYEELYSASPVKAPRQPKPESKNMKAAPIGKKRVANSLGDVASKLDSMFSDPEAKMGLSQPMVLPAQPGISRQLVQVTKPSSNQELDHPVQPKIPNQSTARDAESYMQDDDPAQISTVVEKHVDASTPKDQDVRQESESRGKRKAVLKTGSSSKRRRAEILGGPPLHSSPRNLAEEDSKKSEARRSAVKKKSPTRRSTRFSPRLRARELESRRLEDDSPAPENLVDDHLARKQPIISFGAKGAKNQGVSSSVIRSAARKPENSLHVQQPDGTNGFSDRKRKLAKTTGKDEQLTKKYKSGAPLEVIQNPFNHSRDDDEEFRSSPPQAVLSYDGMIQIPSADEELPEVHPIEGQKHSQKASIASRKSSGFEKRESQLSHVDMNGSPITALQIDHIGRAHQKLSKIAPIQPESLHSPSPAGPLFGQKIHLTGITKARPSSPAEVNTQFVPHHKTADGSYQGIATKEVIAPEKALSDPFFQKTAHQTSNGFTNRLVSGLTPQQGNAHVSDQISKPLKSLPPNVDRKQPQKAPKLPSRQEDMPPSNSSSDDSESDDSESDDSSEQQSIESSVESVEDDNHPGSRWHVALRPHYSKLSDAVHRVADEVILRLSNEEDVVGLLVDQYKDGGAKILGSHIQGRDAQKVNMQSQINHKRRKLVKIYGDARSGVEKRKTAIEKSTVTRFEKIWKQEQDSLQTKISQRRRSSLC
ncbi:hypothetical protein BJ878DRAFT_133318 [Calycina marina]|uniref:Uncharacterized protein n=1 Tax=Calycina marina TaxID=1763456 RepID=A0A9P8CDV1_9HELO|nr:hypothetical protein BJ878DRAFT_133318 [Calycina marina]